VKSTLRLGAGEPGRFLAHRGERVFVPVLVEKISSLQVDKIKYNKNRGIEAVEQQEKIPMDVVQWFRFRIKSIDRGLVGWFWLQG
jgi:hypothetical protein